MAEGRGLRPRLDSDSTLLDLVTSEQRFRVLFENAADVGLVTDARGIITYVTPSVTHCFGYAPEDLLGQSGRELFAARGFEELELAIAALDEYASKSTFTARMRTLGGELRWVDISVQNLLGHSAVRGFVANVRDVTERIDSLDALRAARAQQSAILRRSHDLTMFFEPDGTIAWVSPNCDDLFGISAESFIGRNGLTIVHPDDRERVTREFLGMEKLDDAVRTRYRATDLGGDVRWIEEIATNLIDDPDVGYIVGNMRDVTEEHVATHSLAASEARHRSILDTAQEGIWVTDEAGRTVFANPRMAAILGTNLEMLEAGSRFDFVNAEEQPVVEANDGMSGQGEIRRYETELVRPDGMARWVLVSSAPLADAAGLGHEATIGILHMVTDITERKHDEAELRRITLHDALTGLPNRRLLTDRLARHLEHGSRRPTAVLSLNVDNFKDINDSLGHAAGDEALVEIARRLREAARSGDTVARSGGDEFLVLSEVVADIDEAVTIAERLRASLQAPLHVGNSEFVVTVSVGIAMSPPSEPTELVRGAGIAMYRAKQNGRDGIAVFDHHNEAEVQERVQIQTDLRRAVTNQEFEVWYQPIVRLDDAEVRGVEALVRWRHPTRGLLLPGAFMSVAESTGLIREIGLHVLETACRDAAAWMDLEQPVRVSVNISGMQVVDKRLCAQVADVITRTGIDPEWLTLEVTESAAMHDQETAEQNLFGLRALGVRLALDDFGTGYSSLSFLRQLPVSIVKIDQSFVAGLGVRREDDLIVAGVISMAHALGHSVTAEGIETVTQLEALRRLGCRFGQGFLWSRAVPLPELSSAIAAIELHREEYLRADMVLHEAEVTFAANAVDHLSGRAARRRLVAEMATPAQP